MGRACGGSQQHGQYEITDKNGKTKIHKISKKNIETIEKYSQGAAARNYTKNMKNDLIMEIAGLKKPENEPGDSRRTRDSKIPLYTADQVQEILKKKKYQNLVWNNYWVDIGEGRQYKGQWEKTTTHKHTTGNNKPGEKWRGFGTIKYEDGSKYEGQSENGLFEGKGRKTESNGDFYHGEWKDGLQHGKGTNFETKGTLYDGDWLEGKRHGKGVETSDFNKIKYDGEFIEDEKTGHGSLIFSDGHYVGSFVRGEFHGKGEYSFKDANGVHYKKYTGDFDKNKMTGYGRMTNADQSYYEGEFYDGTYEGQGFKQQASGDWYKGQWSNGKLNGHGQYFNAKDQTITESEWENGKKKNNAWQVNGAIRKTKVDIKGNKLKSTVQKARMVRKMRNLD